MSLRRDDLYQHGQHHPYGGHSHGGHHRSFSHNSALSPHLSVAIPHLRQEGSYGVDHLRYPPDSRGEIDPQGYAGLDFRQQQGQGSAPTGWPPAQSQSTSRGAGDIYQSPLSATSAYSYLDTHAATQMMESPPQGADPYHSPSRATSSMNRLPPNSMLLTPLVASGAVADSGYGAEGYYDDDKAQRTHPSSASNLDQGSGDEY